MLLTAKKKEEVQKSPDNNILLRTIEGETRKEQQLTALHLFGTQSEKREAMKKSASDNSEGTLVEVNANKEELGSDSSDSEQDDSDTKDE